MNGFVHLNHRLSLCLESFPICEASKRSVIYKMEFYMLPKQRCEDRIDKQKKMVGVD